MFNDIFRSTRLKIDEYFEDIVLLGISGLISNYLIYLAVGIILGVFTFKVFPGYDFFPLTLAALKIAVWIIFFLSLKEFWLSKAKSWFLSKKSFYDFDMNRHKMTDRRFLKEWLFQGNTQPYKGGLLLTNSNSGCLIKSTGILGTQRIWKNFVANISIEFLSQTKDLNDFQFQDYFGVIFRAQNLDDYFMLEFVKIDEYLVLRPHTRFRGNWDAPILNADINAVFLGTKRSFTLNIDVLDDITTISLEDESIKWLLPTHVETNLKQHDESSKKEEILTRNFVTKTYFRDRAGMFGFRCYGNQIAFIKSLDIKGKP